MKRQFRNNFLFNLIFSLGALLLAWSLLPISHAEDAIEKMMKDPTTEERLDQEVEASQDPVDPDNLEQTVEQAQERAEAREKELKPKVESTVSSEKEQTAPIQEAPQELEEPSEEIQALEPDPVEEIEPEILAEEENQQTKEPEHFQKVPPINAEAPKFVPTATGLVEIEYPRNYDAPYRERRSLLGISFGVQYSPFFPKDFSLESGSAEITYQPLFANKSLQIIEGQLGVRLNTLLGSIIVEGLYGSGTVANDSTGIAGLVTAGTLAEMSVTKKGFGLTAMLDTILPDPYIVPYASYRRVAFDYKITADGSLASGSTQYLNNLAYGVLIQLNWIDRDSWIQGAKNYGLENTYLDLFYTAYSGTQATDPSFNSPARFGGGVRFEF